MESPLVKVLLGLNLILLKNLQRVLLISIRNSGWKSCRFERRPSCEVRSSPARNTSGLLRAWKGQYNGENLSINRAPRAGEWLDRLVCDKSVLMLRSFEI